MLVQTGDLVDRGPDGVAVMDLARSLGLNRLAIATEVNEGEAADD